MRRGKSGMCAVNRLNMAAIQWVTGRGLNRAMSVCELSRDASRNLKITSYNALRVRPTTNSSQRCDEFHMRVDPESRVSRHLDYFGTEVLEFGIPGLHDHLTIDVRARVVTSEPVDPPTGPWEALPTTSYHEAAGVTENWPLLLR